MRPVTQTQEQDTPVGRLERALIDEFVRQRGYDPEALRDLPEDERRRLLAEASVYASGKLVEVEARSHLLEDIHSGTAVTPGTGLH